MRRSLQNVFEVFCYNSVTNRQSAVVKSTFHVLSRKVCVASTHCSQHFCSMEAKPLCFKHALLVSKITRYELECQRFPYGDKSKQEEVMRKNVYDYDVVLQHHLLHKEFEQTVVKTLNECGIETKIVNRSTYTQNCIDWADIIIPTGGDGTFLMAASRVWGNSKLVVGLNSDPTRSEGYLCLPAKYSTNIKEAIRKLQEGEYEWLLRKRIRITLEGDNVEAKAMELSETRINPTQSDLGGVEQRCISEEISFEPQPLDDKEKTSLILPVLALNEVFMGESLSSRVSYCNLSVDGGVWTKVKSSGICVCTGSGSTSWHLSINRITEQSVSEVMKLLDISDASPDRIKEVSDQFNRNLVFNCDDPRMSYTVRDLISAGVWPDPKGLRPRGFANKIEIKSKCFDGGLVVDGGVFFGFNEGIKATLEIHDSDALRSVRLIET